jgi:hypothetical protein
MHAAASLGGDAEMQGKAGARDYGAFVERKLSRVPPTGITSRVELPAGLFPHQAALTAWALRRGRAAIFSATGTGKMFIELAWADAVHRHTGRPVMIHTPLAVAAQIAREGKRVGIQAKVCREPADLIDGINITNYERRHRFDSSVFAGVVLDESSCIKHSDTRTFAELTAAYRDTPFKLPATATPAPNDWTELGTHAEFLGICTKQEMLAEFFCHDGGDTSVWRLKGHAREIFWRWVASWGAMLRSPADLGFDDSAYVLPKLHICEHQVDFELPPAEGMLFAVEAQSLSERREARKASMDARVAACAAVVNAEPDEAWVVWGELNAECDALEAAIPGAIQVAGADDIDTKEQRLTDFAEGRARVLVSKASIAGWGCNWQHAARMAFVGVNDSWESWHQAIRRCWRFGQKREVHVHVFASRAEGAVVANLKRKERDAEEMAASLSTETRDAVMAEVTGLTRQTNAHHNSQRVRVPAFLVETA